MIELWAEAGPCDKSIDKALAYVDMVHAAGAHALKVQWYNPDTIFAPNAPRYDNTSGPALTQNTAAANPIYPYHLWEPVIDKCRSLNVRFIPSVFDFEAVDVAGEYDLPLLKIASGDITYLQLIAYASQGRQLALSTGAATVDEIQAAVASLDFPGVATHILMACHLEYPTPYHRANIARSYALQYEFPGLVPGFSDHTPGYETIPLIVASGCQVIEKHVTLAQGLGYDSDFALSAVDLRNAVLKIEGTVAVMGDAEIVPDASELPAREGARRSPYAARDLAAGQVLTADDIIMLRPDYGVSPSQGTRFIGMSFEHPLAKGDRLG